MTRQNVLSLQDFQFLSFDDSLPSSKLRLKRGILEVSHSISFRKEQASNHPTRNKRRQFSSDKKRCQDLFISSIYRHQILQKWRKVHHTKTQSQSPLMTQIIATNEKEDFAVTGNVVRFDNMMLVMLWLGVEISEKNRFSAKTARMSTVSNAPRKCLPSMDFMLLQRAVQT